MSMYGKSRLVCEQGASLTKQQFKEECDVNNIVRRFDQDGIVMQFARGTPAYMDVSEVGDYRSALERVRLANEFFMQLPAKVRARFSNDPAVYIDEAGSLSPAELKELGLVVPDVTPPVAGVTEENTVVPT